MTNVVSLEKQNIKNVWKNDPAKAAEILRGY